MIIEKALTKYTVFSEDTLAYALEKISDNKSGVVFVLAQNGLLEGVLTDGDFRRWLLKSAKMDLSIPAGEVCNKEFVFCDEHVALEKLNSIFSDRILYIPLVDRQKRLVGVATKKNWGISIGEFTISQDSPSFLIAEIGNNHNGSIDLAFQLIDKAYAAGADCAKFQMRDMASMYRKDISRGESDDLGAQYVLDLLSRFQLSNQDMFKAFDYCKRLGILPLCTPWDVASLNVLESYGMPAYKVASADLTNLEFLEVLCQTQKPLICSTGMSSESEISEAVKLFKRYESQYVLLHCNSTYPAPFKDINLNYLDRLKELGGGCIVGYSGHERGYAVAIAAVARGAKVIEKHLTLDRSMEGNDHRVSLLPHEFSELVQGVREVELSLGTANPRKITQGEMMNREVLGKSVLASRYIRAGEIISGDDLLIRSPGKGLAPYRKKELVGRVCKRDMKEGDFFFPSDIDDKVILPRNYHFNRPFGVPVRYHDVANILPKSNFDLLEFHLSYKDMELDPEDYLSPEGYNTGFVVHSPELFAGDHIMDLSSPDESYRAKSLVELQRVIDVTRKLNKFFPKTECPCIIINAGGYSLNEFIPIENRSEKYHLIAKSLADLDSSGVEIIPQTMPPFPWHFGGQRYHNLFKDYEDIVNFCETYNMRVCLDISHSKLACNHSGNSFSLFLDRVAPFAAHLHIADAEGIDGEGLQIGDGDIDFLDLGVRLSQLCPDASFIPEIWQGHKNDGEGFWIGLSRLEGGML